MIMRCKECNDPLLVPAGGYVVIESKIRNGIGLAIIKADGLDQDACEDDRICCALCLGNYVGKKLAALNGEGIAYYRTRVMAAKGGSAA